MEEETVMSETEQGDTVSNEAEPIEEIPIVQVKRGRGRGRPPASKERKVGVTGANQTELVSANSNGGSPQPQRGRGRPRLSDRKDTQQQGSGDNHAHNSEKTSRGPGRPRGSKKQASNDTSETERSPMKASSPKKSPSESVVEKAAAEDLPNGGSVTPKRGRPKGSTKRKAENLTSGEMEEGKGNTETPRKRGRPKGSPNKKPRLMAELGSDGEAMENLQKRGRGRPRKMVNNTGEGIRSNGISKMPRRGRGRPRKSGQQGLVTGNSVPVKRGRGRPKGSLNKVRRQVGRPRKLQVVPIKGKKRGRPRLNAQPGKRGRPRKYPLPLPEELKKPKVWKPLGRPRKYPRVDPPEGASMPRRGRGRPRKSESKRGVHLRKSLPAAPSTDGPRRKRGRPPITPKNEGSTSTPRKRGRPKGSFKKKATREIEIDGSLPSHSEAENDSPAAGAEEVERETVGHGNSTQETPVNQDVSPDNNQA